MNKDDEFLNEFAKKISINKKLNKEENEMLKPEDLGTGGTLSSQPPRMTIKPDSLEDVVCSECSHNQFEYTILIKNISPLISPDGKRKVAPVQAFACKKCGNVNDELNPFKSNVL